jgi:predicted peroxiredoxin
LIITHNFDFVILFTMSSFSKGHPSSLKAPHESLSLLVRLLGASSDESRVGSHEYQGIPPISGRRDCEIHGEVREDIMSMLQKEGLKTLSCPALSLKHDREENPLNGLENTPSTDVRSRKQVQGNAAALLAREMRSSEDASENTNGIVAVTSALCGNVYESFAVLVDSRLRAYSNFLALQGISLARKDPSFAPADLKALEQKIEALLAAGRKISVDSVSTHFEESRLMEDDDVESAPRVSLPLIFQVQINLIVPRSGGDTEKVSVSLSAPGQITGKSSSPLVERITHCDTF